jgi:hypothetical protein
MVDPIGSPSGNPGVSRGILIDAFTGCGVKGLLKLILV